MGIADRLKHAWNAFNQVEFNSVKSYGQEWSVGGRPDRPRIWVGTERSIISSIYTRMAIDVSSVDMRHVRLDDQGRYQDDIDSGLNDCLTVEANVDQAAQQFRRDVAMTLFESGAAAIVPVDTTINPLTSGGWDIKTLRVGEILSWYPQHVRVNLYNEKIGRREQLVLPKTMVAVVENPFFSVMNEPNSTLQRLIRKLALLDQNDESLAAGKLDIIIQLPYVIKSEARRQQAEARRKDIEFQLSGSKYGIAYTDGTEKITQLNRASENNLLAQVELLINKLYVELGLTPEVMNGTATEPVMLNYRHRTIEPLCDAIVESMRRVFLTKTARTQGQSIFYFMNPFKLIPIGGDGGIADIADKFSRNEILSSNEIRGIVGFKPDPSPKSDQLINSNMPVSDTGVAPDDPNADPEFQDLNNSLDQTESELDSALAGG